MIKKGDIKVGDYYYSAPSMRIDSHRNIRVDREVCTWIGEYEDDRVHLDTEYKLPDGTEIHRGTAGYCSYKSLDDMKEVIGKKVEFRTKVIKNKIEELEQELLGLQSYQITVVNGPSDAKYIFKKKDES